MPPPSRFNPYPTPDSGAPGVPPSRFTPAPTGQTAPSTLGGGVATVAPAPAVAAPAAPAAAAAPAPTSSLLHPDAPTAKYLSEQEQAAILASLKRSGWTIIGGAAVPEVKWGNNLVTGAPQATPTGAYTINIADPDGGNTQPAAIFPGNPMADGTPTWIPSATPDALPKPQTTAAQNTVEMADGSRWEAQGKNPDGTTKWVQIGSGKVSNPDTDRSTALKAQSDQADIDRRRANELAGRGYLTDNEWIAFQLDGEKNGLTKEQIGVTRDRYSQQKKIEDAKLQPEIDQIIATTGHLNAQSALASNQAGQVASATDINRAKAPGEIAETGARTNLANSQALQARTAADVAKGPRVQDVGSGLNIYSQDPLSGRLTADPNANFIPKTQADVAARMGQLQVQAQQKKAELVQRGQMDPNFTPERQTAEWHSWWDQNIETQKQALQTATDMAAAEEERQAAATRTAAYTSANAAGTQAISAYNAQAPRVAAPGFGAVASKLLGGGQLSPSDANAFIVPDVPDLQQQAHAATMEALKYISPTAAQATGAPMPNYGRVDVAGGLNQLNYGFNGAPSPAVAAPVQAAAVVPQQQTTAMPNDWYQQLLQNQRNDVALQRIQANVPPFDPYGNSQYSPGGF
jgi:hypothetical protein